MKSAESEETDITCNKLVSGGRGASMLRVGMKGKVVYYQNQIM